MYRTIYRWLNGFDPIPDDEIDAEVRRILVEHPGDPVGEAERIVERLRTFKTKRQYRELVKAERALVAVQRVRF